MALRKPEAAGVRNSQSQSASSQSTYLTLFSAILEFLSSTSWEDGSRREPGSLTLTVSSGRWSGKLKDPNRKGYAYLSGDTVDALLESLENGLANDQVDWREDKPFSPGRK